MNFRGGVIIIGSLIWDPTSTREKWRQLAFKNIKEKTIIPINIRYGRESSTRKDTYTMIFSNHSTTLPGQAFILEFANPIKNFSFLQNQGYALATAEGICKDVANPNLTAGWGAVGILFNPEIDKKDKANADLIRNKWAELQRQQEKSILPKQYILGQNEMPVVDKDGFLSMRWTAEMDEFDILLATVTKPKPKHILSSKEIADRMNEKNYWTYFDMNKSHGIFTFQDAEIEFYRGCSITPDLT